MSEASSLSEVCSLFDIVLPENAVDIKSTAQMLRELRKRSTTEGGCGGSNDKSTKKTKISNEANDNSSPSLQLPATDLR